MERLTKCTEHGIVIRKDLDIGVITARDFDKLQYVLSVLAAYENLGVTPEQVRQMKSPWHKVADGDLPPEPKTEKEIKKYLTAQKSIRGPYYVNTISKYYGDLACSDLSSWWWQEHCMAWMELPEYEEEQP